MKKIQKTIALLALFAFSVSSFALDKPHVQVSAQGSIEVLPDYMQLSIEIEKTGKDKAQLKAQVDQITQLVLDVTKELAINADNVEAAQLSIYPQYTWQDNKRIYQGDTVQRSVQIKLYQLDKYTALADKIAALDITRMNQQGYGFDDKAQHQNTALVKALEQATLKAEVIAQTMNKKLGSVYQVSESGSNFAPMYMKSAVMMEAADVAPVSAAPLEIRPQTVSATVNVIFLLK